MRKGCVIFCCWVVCGAGFDCVRNRLRGGVVRGWMEGVGVSDGGVVARGGGEKARGMD